MEASRKVAEVPRPALASGKTGWAMAWMHLIIWNAWKSAYFYADKFPEGDFDNFREYARLSIKFLVDHHDAEEKTLFPMLEEKIPGSMEKNHEQHEAFLQPVGFVPAKHGQPLADGPRAAWRPT